MSCKYTECYHWGSCERSKENILSSDAVLSEVPSDLIPTSWLDPLLTGKTAIVGNPPYNCHEIEILLSAIRERVKEWEARHLR